MKFMSKKIKIKKKDLLKMFKKANRELALELGHKQASGAHQTDRDRPRRRVRKEDINE